MDIKLCDSCKGEGRHTVRDRDGYSSYHCVQCNGTGKQLTSDYAYSVPFDSNKSEIYKVDSAICELIREMTKLLQKDAKETLQKEKEAE